MKRTPLLQSSKSPVALCKARIQASLREITIKRDGGCVLRHYPEAGNCGGYPPRAASGFGFEDDDRLVGARHDGLGDGDQVLLLAENAEARGLALAGIKLCGPALGRMDASGLDLGELYVEFRAVANAPLQDGQDSDARQVGQ